MANTALLVTGLAFDKIRLNLRNFLATKSTFKDIDFTDSAVGTLLDLLAYNSYLLAFYANMSVNEAFLDTAQLYDSVVSRAKALGYRPLSAQGASANVQVTFTAKANSTVRSLDIAKGTGFTTQVNGTSYFFSTPRSYVVVANTTNGFTVQFTITEGQPLTHRFTYSPTANNGLTLPNADTDLRSLAVTAQANGVVTAWVEASDIFAVNGTSPVYFVDAAPNHLYRVTFGDGVLGRRPDAGSTVTVTYNTCAATKPNGAAEFTATGLVGGQAAFSLTTVSRAQGGTEQEPLESIRFHAPRAYETQHRGVTADDYKRLLLQLNPDLTSVNAWGGEANDPPIYGKMFLAVKPAVGATISLTRKESLRAQLKQYNVQTISPEFVDATFLYILPDVAVSYDRNRTNLQASDIALAVGRKIAAFESQVLNRFGGHFHPSRFLEAVDAADQCIAGSSLFLRFQKRFVPLTNGVKASYTFNFNHPIEHPHPGHKGVITSTAFTYNGRQSFLDDDGFGTMRIFYLLTDGTKVTTVKNTGTVDYTTGLVTVNAFTPQAFEGTEVAITIEPPPNAYAAEPVNNQILLIRDATVTVTNERTGIAEITNQPVSTLGAATSLLSPSFSATVAF